MADDDAFAALAAELGGLGGGGLGSDDSSSQASSQTDDDVDNLMADFDAIAASGSPKPAGAAEPEETTVPEPAPPLEPASSARRPPSPATTDADSSRAAAQAAAAPEEGDEQSPDPTGVDDANVETLVVVCPEGVTAGELLTIEASNGMEVDIEVPEGVGEGDEFEVEIDLSAGDQAEEAVVSSRFAQFLLTAGSALVAHVCSVSAHIELTLIFLCWRAGGSGERGGREVTV